jgi:hypothetical protein
MQKSIFYESTGRVVTDRDEINAIEDGQVAEFKDAVVRDNTVLMPRELEDGAIGRRSVWRNAREQDGFDRNNAVGDVVDAATGYQVAIDTLTYIKKQTTDQKFYEEPPADYMPLVVGEGAFSNQLLTNRTYSNADDFESGILRTGASDAHVTEADIAIDGVTVPVANWAKTIGYTIFDVEMALRANNWDIIEKKHSARKKNWDLGIQKTAFLGVSSNQTGFPGLLTNPNVVTNTGLITSLINSMTASALQTFVSSLIDTYFANASSACLPNTFVIPYADYLGLTVLTPGTVGTFPVPMIKYLEEAFKAAVARKEKNFRIMPCAYCDTANNPLGLHYYLLYRDDPTDMRFDVPVPYTTTQPNSLNNFSIQDVGYGQFTGLNVYRNLSVLRFTF